MITAAMGGDTYIVFNYECFLLILLLLGDKKTNEHFKIAFLKLFFCALLIIGVVDKVEMSRKTFRLPIYSINQLTEG